jgi:hypothetical protein
MPASFNGYTGDHADLLVRYMFQLTPEEQRALVGRTAASNTGGGKRQAQSGARTAARTAEHTPGM